MPLMSALLRKLRALPPRRFDALLALLVAAETSAESLLWAPLEGTDQLVGLGCVWLMAVGVTPSSIAASLKLMRLAAASKARRDPSDGSFLMKSV